MLKPHQLAGILLVIALIVGAAAAYEYRGQLSQRILGKNVFSTTPVTAQAALQASNPPFQQAEQLRLSGGDPKTIEQLYDQAMLEASDPAQKGQIQYLKAVVMWNSGDDSGAIPILKSVATSADYPPKLRAAAFLELDLIPHKNTIRDPIVIEVFEGDPFSQLLVGTNVSLAYERLLEYSTSYYPLAIPELKLAASDLQKVILRDPTASTSVEVAALKSDALTRISLADTNIAQMRTNPADNEQVPEAMLDRAIAIGKLNHLGDTSLGTAESAFDAALKEYADRGESNAYVYYDYALYEAWKPNPNASQVQSILTPVYASSTGSYASFTQMLKISRTATTSSSTRQNPALLAQLDSRFTALLSSLGWKPSDISIPIQSSSQQ